MLFLLTNDDGVDSPGLESLAKYLAELGEVYAVAPEKERSAAGHSITMHKPLRARFRGQVGEKIKVWETSGSPADCVVIGFFELLPEKPDLVISGINLGPNLGEDLTYSGTVSAAMEGYLCDVPSIAVSLATFENPIWEPAAIISREIARLVALSPGTLLLNVNIPNLSLKEIKGIALTRLGRRRYCGRLTRRTDPFGRPYYWIGGVLEQNNPEKGTDTWAVQNGLVSLTPLSLDLTDYSMLSSLEQMRRALEGQALKL